MNRWSIVLFSFDSDTMTNGLLECAIIYNYKLLEYLFSLRRQLGIRKRQRWSVKYKRGGDEDDEAEMVSQT